ncbi:MAG TPA: hypothetical protein VF221_11100 [Chloroflexota bacterium]
MKKTPTAGPLTEGLVFIAIIVNANPPKTPSQPETLNARKFRRVGIVVINRSLQRLQ